MTAFLRKKSWNSEDENDVPLSETITSGRPWVAKMSRKAEMTAEDVMEFSILTSGHFEKESTRIKKTFPLNGPAKSICNLDHGLADCISKAVGELLVDCFW